uniref:Uncharacterized protein n=1 Tax=Bos mutus grunniens TaxID=30521 RepID=A0A8C0A5M5_BOSMU
MPGTPSNRMPLLENTPKHLKSAVLAAKSLNWVPHGAPAFGSKGKYTPGSRAPGSATQCRPSTQRLRGPALGRGSRHDPAQGCHCGISSSFFPPSHPWTPNEILISSVLRGI